MLNSGWITALVFLADLVLRLGLALRVVMRRLPVGVTLAWLGTIMTFPFLGAAAYLLLGEYHIGKARKRRILEWHALWQREAARLIARDLDETPRTDHRLSRLAESVFSSPRLPGNQLQLLDGADAVFPALIADIDAAKESCDLEYYIWAAGGRVAEVEQALVRAARRGVRCRVLVDAQGSRRFLRKGAESLRAAGVEVRAALMATLLSLPFVRPDLRLHRKIVVIDRRVGYVGSLNMADPRTFKQHAGVGRWVDAMARVEGPAVLALGATFHTTWDVEADGGVSTEAAAPEQSASDLSRAARPGVSTVQVLPSGPAVHVDGIEQIVLQSIYEARDEIVLTTPYFVPSEAILTALLSAAGSGVKVTLIVPAKVDSRLVHHASRAHQADLVAAGVDVALYEGGLLHTKSITVDDRISLFGSLNLDPRSMRLNFEISLAVYDTGFTADLKRMQNSYLARARRLDQATCEARPLRQRLLENAARLLGPLL